MTFLKKFLVLAVIGSSVVLTSCDKDDDDNNNNIVSKTGLPMGANQEFQPNPVNSIATGTADVSYNKDSHLLTYKVTWTSLTSDTIVGSHIHGTAAKGANAGVKHDFTAAIPKMASGTYSGSVTVDGVAIKEDSLLAGFYYLNIHTNQYPAGEIRGQIEF